MANVSQARSLPRVANHSQQQTANRAMNSQHKHQIAEFADPLELRPDSSSAVRGTDKTRALSDSWRWHTFHPKMVGSTVTLQPGRAAAS